MDFSVHKRSSHTKSKYASNSVDIAYRFAKEIHKELKDLVKAMVLFGSTARNKQDSNDIDILIVVDDVSLAFSAEMAQAYRIIVEKSVGKISPKIHVTSMKFTSFWEYIRAGDPIAINILRDGYALIDTGFFEPLQMLLYQGRIRPSQEAQWAYYARAPRSLQFSRGKLLEACIDLYWAVIDACHASLMSINEVPPSPDHVAELMENKLVKQGLVSKKYPWTMRKFYTLSKDIMSGRKKEVSAQEYEKLYAEAKELVDGLARFMKK